MLYLIVGESGSGKSAFTNRLYKYLGLKSVQSYTTRPKRKPDETGHIFLTDSIPIVKMQYPNRVAETMFDGNFYFVTEEQLKDCDLYIIDPSGVYSFIQSTYGKNIEYKIVYLYTKTITRFIRMIKRGDSVRDALRRIKHDKKQNFKQISKIAEITIDAERDLCDMVNQFVLELNGISGISNLFFRRYYSKKS